MTPIKKPTGLWLVGIAAFACAAPRFESAAAPAEAPLGGAIVGRVALRGGGVPARVEVRRIGPAEFLRNRSTNPSAGRLDARSWLQTGVAGGAPIAMAGAERSGEFRATGLTAGAFEVRAILADGRAGFATAMLEAEGQRVSIRVEIPAGPEVLAGRIVRADGSPFRGTVVVTQEALGRTATPWLEGAIAVETDAEGRFEARGLDRGIAEVAAIDPGVLRIRGDPVVIPFPGSFSMTVDADDGPVEGLVRGTGAEGPLASADVLAMHRAERSAAYTMRRFTTGADGRFRGDVHAGDLTLTAFASGHASQSVLVQGAAREGIVMLRLGRTARVAGRVLTGRDGKPLAGVPVYGSPLGTLGALSPVVSTVTDAEGRFALEGLPPGESDVFALGGGWSSEGLDEAWDGGWNPVAQRLEAGSTSTVDLQVVPASMVKGSVLDPEGKAVPGALVSCVDRLRSESPAVATDADGAFVLDALHPGEVHAIRASAPDFAPAESRVESGADGATIETVLRFARPRWLRVQVVFGDGAVGGATVEVDTHPDSLKQQPRVPAPPTDPDGYTIVGPVPMGSLELVASAKGFLPTSLRLPEAVLERGGESPVVIRLAPAGAAPRSDFTIRGRIVGPEGVALTGVALTHGEPYERPLGAWKTGGHPVAVAPDGSFEATGLQQAKYGFRAVLRADGVGYVAESMAGAESRDLVLTLAPAAGIEPDPSTVPAASATWTFRIVDAEGRPVPQGEVRYEERRGEKGEDKGESGREFFMGGVYVRRADPAIVSALRVRFLDLRSEDGEILPLGSTVLGPVKAGGAEFRVEVPKEQFVSGVVRRPDGTPERGVLVREADAHTARTARTDSLGRFRLGGLSSGEIALQFEVRRAYVRTNRVVVRAGSADNVIDLHGAVDSTIVIEDPEGKPLENVEAWIELPDDDDWTMLDNWDRGGPYSGPNWVFKRTPSDGTIRFRRLDPGRAYVLVVAPDGMPKVPPTEFLGVRLATWRPKAHEAIRLERALKIGGTVRDGKGELLPGARVFARVAPSQEFEERATAWGDGTFEIGRLRTGDVDLVAVPRGAALDAATIPRAIRVAAGAGDVTLVVQVP